ncbi:pyruvate, phosphate dikinase [Flavobacteriaceae bacterium]|nr:pyruvate, phosphate dikinase [Flavobacteriaceae bacterium]
MTKDQKFIYNFGDGVADGNASMKNILGGKGANLAEMSKLKLPVPLGFTISTEVCDYYYQNQKTFPAQLEQDISESIKKIENNLNSKFGGDDPLLFSVRSGSRASMPGMMDTILNLGLNDKTVESLAKKSNNRKFALDSYRRFIQMYSNVVLNLEMHDFETILDDKKLELGILSDTELQEADLEEIVQSFKDNIKKQKKEFPQDIKIQLFSAIKAVFDSWMNDRAVTYRSLNNIPESWGTAVNIQSMIFGNMGKDCATGVAFSRNPSTGKKSIYGEYLINAQGEDVVAGIRTPQSITKSDRIKSGSNLPSMEESMPDSYTLLLEICQKLEKHYKDMQDMEFTIQNGKLWMLQTRNGKRSANCAINLAVDMVNEGLINKTEALLRIDPSSLDQLLHPTIDPKATLDILTRGLPASPGAACGAVYFSSENVEIQSKNKDVILVRIETSPDDIKGMHLAKGILTARGGMTSHAAVVARGMGKPCVSGAAELNINYKEKTLTVKGKKIKEGDIITINGSNGEIVIGTIPTLKANLSENFQTVMVWADGFKSLKIRTNAETAKDCQTAIDFGAQGIGLCRTEHMFFNADRMDHVYKMILSSNISDRKEALEKLLPIQQNDFEEIFKIMADFPVNIRLLDPPLHEFLPHTEEEISRAAQNSEISIDAVYRRISELKEQNPMLGHRGCRLGISYPEIYEMQARAIFEAAATVKIKDKKDVLLEIMIPLVGCKEEIEILKKVVLTAKNEVEFRHKIKLKYQIGTMIELPRAAILAGEIAQEAEYFSFGTNDLTQTALGISRDDSSNFLDDYKLNNIFHTDPFVTIDRKGVGELIKIAIRNGRNTRKDIKLGVCGEHGGDPQSIEFFHNIGLDYVSCSPYRVPIARLAAAISNLKNN